MGFFHWNVEPTGTYGGDCQRGREVADELISLLANRPTNGDMLIVSDIINDMVRCQDQHHGLRVGFGARLAEAVAIGAYFMELMDGKGRQ